MEEQSTSLDLWRYIGMLRRWLWLLVLATLLAAVTAFVVSRMETPVYQTSTRLLINEAPNTRVGTDYNTVLVSERVAKTYAELLTERMVLETVIQRTGITVTVAALKSAVQVSTIRDTQLIELKVEHTDPQVAASVANTLAAVFIEQVQELQAARYRESKDSLGAQLNTLDRQIQQAQTELNALGNSVDDQAKRDRLETSLAQSRQSYANVLQTYEQVRLAEAQTTSSVTQVEVAIPPEAPIRPRTATNTALGAAVGLLLALGVVFLVESLEDTLRNVGDLQVKWKLPLLGFIPYFDHTESDATLITATQPRSPIAERFRALRTNIQYASVDRPLRTILVTSPSPMDGKSTVAANLAVALAQGGRRVVLVDGDLRRPSLHHQFQLPNMVGMSALFVQPQLHLNGTVQRTTTQGLWVIPAGKLPPNPSELLSSDRMSEIMRTVGEQADVIIIDTPPATSVTDALALAPRVDGVLLVVQPGRTRRGACQQTVEELRRSGANILGAVVNAVKAADARYYYSGYYHYYYYSYGYGYGADPQSTGHRSRPPLVKLWRSIWPARHHRRHRSQESEDRRQEQESREADTR